MKQLRIKDFPKFQNSQVLDDYYLLTDIRSRDGFIFDQGSRLGFHIIAGVFKGRLEVSVNNELFVIENSLFACYNGAIINNIKVFPGSEITLFGFSPEYFFPDKNLYAINHVWNKIGRATTIRITEERGILTTHLVEMMRAVFGVFSNQELMKEALHGYIEVVLSAAGQWYIEDTPERDAESSSSEDTLMSNFISDMLAFSTKEREISFYAGRANLSPKYYSQLIHKACGRYPADMIRDQVIIEAKGLLSTQLYTIQQISEKLNFPNSSYFAKYFKTATGLSPKEFMKKGEAYTSPDFTKQSE